jgi:hypothetical protein
MIGIVEERDDEILELFGAGLLAAFEEDGRDPEELERIVENLYQV